MEPAAPSGDQATPPFVVKNAPMSVPAYSVLCVKSSESTTKALTGMSGRFPLMSVQVVAAPAVPLMLLKTCFLPSQEIAQEPNPENATYTMSLLEGSTTMSVIALVGRVAVTMVFQAVPPLEVTSTSPWSLPT